MKEKGQVSIEVLLLAGVIILITVAVFGYYIQIKDSTTGMEIAKIEALRQIAEAEEKVVLEKIEYKIDPNKIYFCLFFEPESFDFAEAKIEEKVASLTEFKQSEIEVYENPVPNLCE